MTELRQLIAEVLMQSHERHKLLKTIHFVVYETDQDTNEPEVAVFSEDDHLSRTESPPPVPLYTALVFRRRGYAGMFFKIKQKLAFYLKYKSEQNCWVFKSKRNFKSIHMLE